MVSPNLTQQYEYDPRSVQYRSKVTGRYVAQAEVENAIEEHIENGFNDLDALLSAALSDTTDVDLNEFYEAMRLQLKILHVQVGVIGAGGVNNVTQSTYGTIGNVLKSEYKYAQGFVDDLAQGKLTERQARARLGMYANKIWGTYQKTGRQAAVDNGYSEERRVLSPLADSCADCVRYANMGWQPIGTLPAPTEESRCMSNCRCRMQYR